MSIKDDYLHFRDSRGLRTSNFADRVVLQKFIKDRLDDIWLEKPSFTNGGLLQNYMTNFAIGFAYYDCRPTSFCQKRCYGLPIAGLHDYYMLRLGVITSESFKKNDVRFLRMLRDTIRSKRLRCLKLGHWGDAVLEQIPAIADLVKGLPDVVFWWYTRKQEIALAANSLNIPNLRTYLSLDPSAEYPSRMDYPYPSRFTYLLGDGEFHPNHKEMLSDPRLVAVFTLKKGRTVEDPSLYGLSNDPKVCEEKRFIAEHGKKGRLVCLSCKDRCNFLSQMPTA